MIDFSLNGFHEKQNMLAKIDQLSRLLINHLAYDYLSAEKGTGT